MVDNGALTKRIVKVGKALLLRKLIKTLLWFVEKGESTFTTRTSARYNGWCRRTQSSLLQSRHRRTERSSPTKIKRFSRTPMKNFQFFLIFRVLMKAESLRLNFFYLKNIRWRHRKFVSWLNCIIQTSTNSDESVWIFSKVSTRKFAKKKFENVSSSFQRNGVQRYKFELYFCPSKLFSVHQIQMISLMLM